MTKEIGIGDQSASQSDARVERRGLLRLGTLLTALTGASVLSTTGADSAQAASTAYIPIAEKAAPSGVATLDANAKILPAQLPDLSSTYARKGEPSGMPAALQLALLLRTTGIARGIVQGSSTVEGANAVPRTERWTNRVEKMLQASFNPQGISGGYSLRGNDPVPIWLKTGIANDANIEHWARITRLASTVFCAPIMIGSNDAMAQVPLATFKTNILGMIQKTHTALGKSVWTPLIGMPARPDTPLAIPNSSYIAVLRQVADENPQWCTFHDLSGYFPTSQSVDTLNLMDADNTHPTTLGHAYQADLLAHMWGIPARPSGKASPPAVGTGGTKTETSGADTVAGDSRAESTSLAFDKFDRADANNLGTTNSGQVWQVGAGSWRIDKLAAQGLGYAVVDVGSQNYDASAVFTFDTMGGVVGIPLKYIDESNRITAYFDVGVLRLAKTEAGVLSLLAPDAPYVRTVGMTATLRVTYASGVVTTYINGEQKQTASLGGADLTKFGPVTKVGLRQNEYNAHIRNFLVV